jgi:hypothetical protein
MTRKQMWRVGAVTVVMTLGGAAAAAAREPERTMAGLEARLTPGTEIDLVDRKGQVVHGAFVRADDRGVLITTYRTAEGRRVPVGDIISITRPGDPVLNGALIGGAFGALPFILLAEKPGDIPITEAVSAAGTTAAFGALIDFLIKGRTVVYRAPSRHLSWSVAPHPVRRGAGVRVALTF